MIQILVDKNSISKSQKLFQKKLKEHFNDKISCRVGFPGGSFQGYVHYAADLDLWFGSLKEYNRFWNGFGIGRPNETNSNTIVGEINFPFEGINRRIAGAFAIDENNNLLLLHRGKIGGGRPGNGKNHFTENFRGDFIIANDGGRDTEFCVVGELNSPYFISQLENFIREVRRIKNLHNKNTDVEFDYLKKFRYTDEHSGTSVTEHNESRIIKRIHGIVVNALDKELKKKGYQTGNDKNRDLFIHKNRKIKKLFEIKTSVSTQCLYSAIGQLLVYSIAIGNNAALVAVFPDKLSKTVEKRLSDLNIQVLYYEWNSDAPVFLNIDEVLEQ